MTGGGEVKLFSLQANDNNIELMSIFGKATAAAATVEDNSQSQIQEAIQRAKEESKEQEKQIDTELTIARGQAAEKRQQLEQLEYDSEEWRTLSDELIALNWHIHFDLEWPSFSSVTEIAEKDEVIKGIRKRQLRTYIDTLNEEDAGSVLISCCNFEGRDKQHYHHIALPQSTEICNESRYYYGEIPSFFSLMLHAPKTEYLNRLSYRSFLPHAFLFISGCFFEKAICFAKSDLPNALVCSITGHQNEAAEYIFLRMKEKALRSKKHLFFYGHSPVGKDSPEEKGYEISVGTNTRNYETATTSIFKKFFELLFDPKAEIGDLYQQIGILMQLPYLPHDAIEGFWK